MSSLNLENAEKIDKTKNTVVINNFIKEQRPEDKSLLARLAFQSAIQVDRESLVEWHNRLRYLYKTAFPDLIPEQVESSQDLHDRFIFKILDPEIRKETFRSRPKSYQTALTEAQWMEHVNRVCSVNVAKEIQ